MDNIKLLEYCKKNPESILDPAYMFIDKDPGLNKYVEQTKKIKNKLIAIKEIVEKKDSKKVVEDLFKDLSGLLGDFANFSEFGCFINAADSSLKYAKQNMDLLKAITKLYIMNRELNEVVPAEWLQALIDKSSSRKKGTA